MDEEKDNLEQSIGQESTLPLQENKMGVKSVGKLLVSMALPMMVSMMVMALYNIVDSIFVAKINEQALTALSLAFPIQNLLIAVSVGIGVGVNTCISKNLGKKDFDMANKCAGNSLVISLFFMIVFVLFGIFGTEWFFSMQTDDKLVIEYGKQYLSLICICCFSVFGQIIFEKILVSTGKTMLTMIMQLVGAAVNIILDPILIFGYCGAPKMGVLGASVATVVGQVCAFLLAVILNFVYNKEVRIRLKDFILSKKAVYPMLAVGVPSMVMTAISSIMALGLNSILAKFSLTAVALMGIFIKLQGFIFMPIFGVCNSVVPIVSYNYGAQKYERINKAFNIGLIMSAVIAVVGFIIVESIPQYILMLFNASENMMEMGIVGLRIVGVSFLLPFFSILSSSYFQALGKGISSLIISVSRQLIIILPVAFLLSLANNVNGVWWALPIAEFCCVGMSFFIFAKCQRKLKLLQSQKLLDAKLN